MARSVTVLIQPDGAAAARAFRIRLRVLQIGAVLVGVAVMALLLIIVLYTPLVRAAARVPGLEREVGRLKQENAKVYELSAALDSLEQRYAQVRRMIGADIVRDPVAVASALPVAPPIRARVVPAVANIVPVAVPAAAATETPPTPGMPSRWPLDEAGYLTRGQIGTDARDEAHPGIDVAVPIGSLVRASGGALVRQVGEDPEYGLFVLLDHVDQYQTMYGHLSRIVVAAGVAVGAGEVVGLSGNTGRSTAPHLHFEVRHSGRSLDPLTMVKEGR